MHKLVLSSVFSCIYAGKKGAYSFFNSFLLWLTYINTPPFSIPDFFSGRFFFVLVVCAAVDVLRPWSLNFKTSLPQLLLHSNLIDRSSKTTNNFSRLTEGARQKRCEKNRLFPNPVGKITITLRCEMRDHNASLCSDFKASVSRKRDRHSCILQSSSTWFRLLTVVVNASRISK